MQGGDWLRPLGGTAVTVEGGVLRFYFGFRKKAVKTDGTAHSPNKDTHTHTHRQNWKVASSGMSKQTVRSDYEHQATSQSAGCIPYMLRSEGRIWPWN